MRRRLWQTTQVTIVLALAGCGFKPTSSGQVGTGGSTGMTGAAGAPANGSGGSSSTGAGGAGVTAGTGGMRTTGGDITGTGGQSCGQTNVSIKPLPPDILIVQDKSGSMSDPAGGNCTGANCSRWSQVSAAIDSVVKATETNVNWGMTFFPIDDTCGLPPNPIVPVGAMNSSPIQAAFTSNQPNGKTPTASALDAAVKYMKTLTDPNPKFLLLATDGLPNCGAGMGGAGGQQGGMGGAGGRGIPGGGPPGGSISADDSPAAEMAVTNAKTAGFPTFVVGIATASDAMATNTLNTMARNGGYPQTGAATEYYSVTDTASLETALNKIIGMTLACTIPLTDKPDNLANVAVSAQDASGKRIQIPQDATNGWSFDATMSNIVLNGSACAQLQSVTLTQYQFIYACQGVKICIDTNDCAASP
jgi:hypothetical protein